MGLYIHADGSPVNPKRIPWPHPLKHLQHRPKHFSFLVCATWLVAESCLHGTIPKVTDLATIHTYRQKAKAQSTPQPKGYHIYNPPPGTHQNFFHPYTITQERDTLYYW